METEEWFVGQLVEVQRRTWPGINKLGGTGRITKINYVDGASDDRLVESIDVKYLVNGGSEKNIDPHLAQPFQELERRGRRRARRHTYVPHESDCNAGSDKQNGNKPSTDRPRTQCRTRQRPRSRNARSRVRASSNTSVKPDDAPPCDSPDKEQEAASIVTPLPRTLGAKPDRTTRSVGTADRAEPLSSQIQPPLQPPKRTTANGTPMKRKSHVPTIVTVATSSPVSPLEPPAPKPREEPEPKAKRGLFTGPGVRRAKHVEVPDARRRRAKKTRLPPTDRARSASRSAEESICAGLVAKDGVGQSLSTIDPQGSIRASVYRVPFASKALEDSVVRRSSRSQPAGFEEKTLKKASSGTGSKPRRQSLEDLYEMDKQYARAFIEEMNMPRATDALIASSSRTGTDTSAPQTPPRESEPIGIHIKPAAKAGRGIGKERSAEDGKSERATDRTSIASQSRESLRYDQFLSAFEILRESRFEGEQMNETDLPVEVNRITKTTTFSDDEIGRHLDRLIAESKVFRSDGILYLV